MSAPRKDRLEAYLSAIRAASSNEVKKGRAGPLAALCGRYRLGRCISDQCLVIQSWCGVGSRTARGPTGHAVSSQSEPLLRSVHLAMAGRNSRLFAQAAALKTAQAVQMKPPAISNGGIVTLYSTATIIQPGGWASIYGTNLASGTATWKGEFPTSLGGTSVTINGKPAYLSFVSPGQINLQAPDDAATGVVPVVVATTGGSVTSSVTLSPILPAFNLLDTVHVKAIILRSDGSGAFGNGAYDVLGPDGDCFGYRTVGARPEI